MKSKLLFLSMVIVTLSLMGLSCSKDIAADVVPETREQITFSVANETITRGEIVSSITEFVVYAVDGDNVIINNATFTKDGDAWSTSATFYWTGNDISFYAYVPSDNFAAEGSMLNGYQMPTDVTEQDDLMVAKCTASSGAVTLSFERIMALVKFSVKDASVAVTSVAISGISDAGEYNMATKEWFNEAATTTSYEAGIDQTIADGGDDGTQITNKSGYLMVLPQTQTSVTVTAINANGKDKEYTLKNVDWKAGTLYNYTISLTDIEPAEEEGGVAYIDLSDPAYSTMQLVADAVEAFDAQGYTKYIVTNTNYTNSSNYTSFSNNNSASRNKNPFHDLETPNVTLDISGVTGLGSIIRKSDGSIDYYYLNSNYFVDANSYTNFCNIVKLILPDYIKALTGAIYGMPDLEEVVATNSDMREVSKTTFSYCTNLKTLYLIGYYNPGSWVEDNLGTCPTENITLYLSYEHQNDDVSVSSVNGKVYWGSYIWKEINLVDSDGVTIVKTYTSAE